MKSLYLQFIYSNSYIMGISFHMIETNEMKKRVKSIETRAHTCAFCHLFRRGGGGILLATDVSSYSPCSIVVTEMLILGKKQRWQLSNSFTCAGEPTKLRYLDWYYRWTAYVNIIRTLAVKRGGCNSGGKTGNVPIPYPYDVSVLLCGMFTFSLFPHL